MSHQVHVYQLIVLSEALSEDNSTFWNDFDYIMSIIPPIEVADIGAEVTIVGVYMMFAEVFDALSCWTTVCGKWI